MNFLQPAMLWAVPLIALPIVIHLINQRRYQTMRWGAMRFLISANRMSKGYARLRQWLILACRTLAIAGLVFAACRPLASGIFGLLGGSKADTTIVLLDRSPSMSQTGEGSSQTKLTAGLAQLVDTLGKLGSSRWVLIESDRVLPREIEAAEDLLDLPEAMPSSASADIPKMLESAAEYIATNKTGRTEIWLCSDLRANDWQRRSSRWQQLRDKFLAFPQSIRFHLFSFAKPSFGNLAVQVDEVERIGGVDGGGSELSVSLKITRETLGNAEADNAPVKVPIQFEIEGARSQTNIELTGNEYELRGHRIPLDSSIERGWGRVSIPADGNAADNEFFFAFDKPMPRRSVLVLEESDRSAPLEFAVSVPPSSSIQCESEFVSPSQLDAVAWEDVSLVLWQAPLPEGDDAKLIDQYVNRGGNIVFFPPDSPNQDAFHGVSWEAWKDTGNPVPVTTWRMDQDLLANTIGGSSLPVGELQTYRYCPPSGGELTSLASLDGGDPLLSRLAMPRGGVYFCSTTTDASSSTLANNGVVLYVAMQRALANGASVLGNARQAVAGDTATTKDLENSAEWKLLAGPDDVISTDYAWRGGVYESDEHLLAVNRNSSAEDHAGILPSEQVEGLFDGLDFSVVQNEIGETSSLVNEIWRAFLMAMIVALLAEAILCVPRKANPREDKNSFFRERKERATVLQEMQGAA